MLQKFELVSLRSVLWFPTDSPPSIPSTHMGRYIIHPSTGTLSYGNS